MADHNAQNVLHASASKSNSAQNMKTGGNIEDVIVVVVVIIIYKTPSFYPCFTMLRVG